MKIAGCVPLAGQGVVARYGDLVAVTDGHEPDPLLSALTEVAAAAGDGRALVLSAVRAALGCLGQPAWACAGVTDDGGVAVLVHGRAVATVGVEGGQEVTLTASDSVIPVSRTFTGTAVTVNLTIGDPAAPDPRFRLDGGVVHGGGLAVTVAADLAGPTVIGPDAAPLTGVPEGPPTAVSGAPTPTVAVAASTGEDDPDPVLVEGVLCAREHFNDPGARYCRQCRIGMNQLPRTFKRRQRPPLGVLVLDDGSGFTLDGDYVIGREPVLDGDVMAGRARPLRLCDPDGSVSRLHLRISLVGWQVEVSDLGSANGSVLHSADGERTLAPFEPTVIEPGARIGIGHRSMQYLSQQGVSP